MNYIASTHNKLFRSIMFLLLFGFIFLQFGCATTAREQTQPVTIKSSPTDAKPAASSTPAGTSNIAGTWSVCFNGVPGTMEIAGKSGGYSGRFNLHGNWEEMLDLKVDGNQISFRRASGDQRYTGRISGGTMSGNFTQGGSGNYPWKADRR